MNFQMPPFSIGMIIAIIVLVLAIVFLVTGAPTNPDTERVEVLGLIAALAVARLT